MGDQRWFYRNDADWNVIAERLKRTACPYCQVVGALIRHGFLRGFDETSQQQTVRARRIFCSNRNARPGCGRTFSVWLANKIRRLALTTSGLWRFLQHAVAVGIAAAVRAANRCSDRTWYRIWNRFNLGQSKIRTALSTRCPPPTLAAEHRPAAHTLAHLHAAFPNADCPITDFQHALRIFLL